jgi:hypothetical protein
MSGRFELAHDTRSGLAKLVLNEPTGRHAVAPVPRRANDSVEQARAISAQCDDVPGDFAPLPPAAKV